MSNVEYLINQYSGHKELLLKIIRENLDLNASNIAKLVMSEHEELFVSSRTGKSISINYLRELITHYIKDEVGDKEIKEFNLKLRKEKQSSTDKLRIIRKAHREGDRLENAILEYNAELVSLIKEEGLKIEGKKHYYVAERAEMILQLSDTHFNELVEIEGNKYDFNVASKRLYLLAQKIIDWGTFKKAKRLVIAFGGDLLNSDRRLDEMLSMATNRALATSLSVRILIQFILLLNKHFDIICVGITGNESRAKQEMGYTDILATDNYDYTIYDMLSLYFEKTKGVTFHPFKAREYVFEVKGKNFLLIHGDEVGAGNIQKDFQFISGKYSYKGKIVDYILAGHIHSTMISDYFSRNSSLVGSNAYSERKLQYVSKASQNLHTVTEHCMDSLKLDLQDTSMIPDNIFGIDHLVDAYNAKSAKKAMVHETIFSVVI